MRSVPILAASLLGAAALQICTPAHAAQNVVTVRADGGTYATVLQAAQNAREGDAWCPDPASGPRCVIRVGPGVFYESQRILIPGGISLVGEGKGTTLLTGGGVVASGARVSDLTIVSDGKALELEEAGSRAELLIVRVALRGGAVALDIADQPAPVRIIDSDIVASSTADEVYGVFAPGRSDPVRIVRTRITAIGGLRAWGFNDNSDFRNVRVELRDTTVLATAQQFAAALELDNEHSTYEIADCDLTAVSSAEAYGVRSHFSLVDSIAVVRTNVSSQGAPGIGFSLRESPGVPRLLHLSEVIVDASNTAVSVSGDLFDNPPGTVRVLRSQLVGGDVALAIDGNSIEAEIARTLLRGTIALSLSGTQVVARASQFEGALEFQPSGDPPTPSTGTCRRVYDANGALLPPTCVPAGD